MLSGPDSKSTPATHHPWHHLPGGMWFGVVTFTFLLSYKEILLHPCVTFYCWVLSFVHMHVVKIKQNQQAFELELEIVSMHIHRALQINSLFSPLFFSHAFNLQLVQEICPQWDPNFGPCRPPRGLGSPGELWTVTWHSNLLVLYQ